MMIVLLICITSVALILGALWGLYGPLPRKLEGFVVAMAGGALIVSVMAELLEPASEVVSLPLLLSLFGVGALTFTLIDLLVEARTSENSGGGLLAAIVVDGVPENLALGVVLISADPGQVLALAGSIFLSNLPEAAGGSRAMCRNGLGKAKVLGLWSLTAALLSAAALLGYWGLSPFDKTPIALVQAFAAGAVVASLATEIFPKAYRDDHDLAGIAVALGLALAFALHQIGN